MLEIRNLLIMEDKNLIFVHYGYYIRNLLIMNIEN
jgi:hypothetical protein